MHVWVLLNTSPWLLEPNTFIGVFETADKVKAAIVALNAMLPDKALVPVEHSATVIGFVDRYRINNIERPDPNWDFLYTAQLMAVV